MANKPEVTIVIPTYNNPQGAIDLVNDFYRLHDPSLFRIISVDQTKDGISFDKEVHLHVRSYRNLGFSKAMNIGWKLSQTPYTLLANDDVRLLSASWYEDAKAHLKNGVLGVNPYPALKTWDGGGTPKWYWEIHDMEKWGWTKDKPYESYTQEDYEKIKSMLVGGDPPGTTMFFTLLRTETREIVGLMDEGYLNNGEDYDLNRRIYLTCKNCNRKKYEHDIALPEGQKIVNVCDTFEPYKILTCTHSLVHHECGVTKQKAAAAKEMDGYDLVARAKNIYHNKWGDGADIYGKSGLQKPNTPWFQEADL